MLPFPIRGFEIIKIMFSITKIHEATFFSCWTNEIAIEKMGLSPISMA
jgi:hypothetical protein